MGGGVSFGWVQSPARRTGAVALRMCQHPMRLECARPLCITLRQVLMCNDVWPYIIQEALQAALAAFTGLPGRAVGCKGYWEIHCDQMADLWTKMRSMRRSGSAAPQSS